MGNIESIEFTNEYIDMCDITVNGSHSYYANGIATHNCNQEARLLALLSKDSKMLNIFLNDEDMHTATAVAIFGEAGHDKKYRKIAKAINFALNYGGSAYTVAKNLDIPVEEAQSYVDTYNARFPECIAWKNKEIQKMYSQGGVVYSIFGRPRQFITRLRAAGRCAVSNSAVSQKIANAVERRVVNHEIQSACLQGSAKVLTNRGYIPIETLFNLYQDNQLGDTKVYTGKEWSDFIPQRMGKKQKATLYLADGRTLDCEPTHKVFCYTGNSKKVEVKKVNELTKEDKVCLMQDTLISYGADHPFSLWFGDVKLTGNKLKDFYYWFGYLLNVEVQEDQESITITFDDVKDGDKFQRMLQSIKEPTTVETVEGKTLITIKSPGFLNYYHLNKEFRGIIEDNLLYAPLEMRQSYIEGCKVSNKEQSVTFNILVEMSTETSAKMQYKGVNFDRLEVSEELVETYNITTSNESHRYVAEGIINKNCGDVCRYLLLSLYHKFFKNRDKHVDFLSTVHDEINFTIDKDVIVQYLREIQDMMTFNLDSWEFPLETSIDVGNNYGQCFPFKWADKERTKLIPDNV